MNSLTKKQLIALAKKCEVECITLHLNEDRQEAIKEDKPDFIADFGDHCMVQLDSEEVWDVIASRGAKSGPFCPAVEELKLGIVDFFKDHRKDLLVW